MDPGNGRIGLFDPNGDWVRSWPIRQLTGDQGVRLYRTSMQEFWAYSFRAVGDSGRTESLFVRHNSSGPSDSIVALRLPPELRTQSTTCFHSDGSISFINTPYSMILHVIPSPKGERAVALNSAYKIAFLSPSGDTTKLIEREVQMQTITDSDWDEGLKEWRDFRAKYPGANCDRTGFDRPQHKPVIEHLVFDDKGRLWVEALTASGKQYDVFDGDGRLVATLKNLPSSGDVDPSIVANRIALVVPDSSGLDFVEVYRFGASQEP